MHVEVAGSGPRLVLVHGSGGNSWPAQRPLAERYTLVMPTRTGYPPNPPLEHIDFDVQARELLEVLEPGDHVVGHSYGGVISLIAAPDADLASLTVHLRFPAEHWRRIRHSNFIERTFGETRRRVKVIGRLPGESSCLSLVWAVLDRASRGWRGLTMTPKALRLLQDLRRQLVHPPTAGKVTHEAVTAAA